jgi:hypothetical protein
VPERLVPGGSMRSGDRLRSPDGSFYAVLRRTGELAVYEEGRRFVGATGTPPGITDPELSLADDGTLVLRDRADDAVAHRTPAVASGPDVALVLQDDGVLVVSAGDDVVWRPHTYGNGCWDSIGANLDPPASQIRTADLTDVLPDGDAIIVTTEPAPGFFELDLTLGSSLTWWKRITLYGPGDPPLGCADVSGSHRFDAFSVPTSELSTAVLTFWKAKFFGHRQAVYDLHDLSPWADTRVRMTWAQD